MNRALQLGLVTLGVTVWAVIAVDSTLAGVDASCRVAGSVSVAPNIVVLGTEARIVLTATYPCPVRQVAIGFGSKQPNTKDSYSLALRAAVEAWLRRVSLNALELAVVNSDPGYLVQPMTSDRSALITGVRQYRSDQAGSYNEAIKSAHRELARVRRPGVDPDQGLFVVGSIVLPDQRIAARREANATRADGIDVYIVGVPAFDRRASAEDLASSPANFFGFSDGFGDVGRVNADATRATWLGLQAVENSIVRRGFSTVAITTTLPAAFDYVADSSTPPALWNQGRLELSWSFPGPVMTSTVSFDVRAVACGRWPLPQTAQVWGRDLQGAEYQQDLESTDVEVPCATVTPTPTATSPTPTPSASPTPTTRPTGVPRPLYLPLALRELPCRVSRGAAVALVIDTSSSMLEPAGNGRTKLETATEAAGRFLDILGFPNDQATVVGFDSAALVAQELTGDRVALQTALAGLASGKGTRIDLGVSTAYGELTSVRRHPGNLPAMVVLTDGQATDGPQAAITEADRAKRAGILVFTIGLGDTVDQAQLRSMASRPEWFYVAATADDLAAVYDVVAADLPCPGDRYWGRRP